LNLEIVQDLILPQLTLRGRCRRLTCYAASMPMTRIEVRRHRPPEQVRALIRAVHEAQREALKLPKVDLGFRPDV